LTLAIPQLDRTTAEDRGLTIADFFVPIRVGERLNTRARDIALVIAGALLIYLTARIAIPVPGSPVPITGQTFGVLLVGGAGSSPSRSTCCSVSSGCRSSPKARAV
jgi:hypothetical protein